MTSKPPFFLGVRPGELLYSALARHSEALGPVGPKAVMSAIFGRANTVATMDLPNNLGELVKRLPPTADAYAEKLAWNHTLLPYYTRFQSPGISDRALSATMGSSGSIHLMLGISTFRTGRPTHLQFCTACVKGMLEEFGSLHWRSAHQLPGVLVCPDHGKPLRRSNVCLVSTNRHEFVPASDETCAPECEAIATSLTESEMAGAVALAQASAALLCRPTQPQFGVKLLAEYHDALRTVGLMKGRFTVNQRQLAARLERHWGGLLDRLEGVGLGGSQDCWLASLVRTSKNAQPPLQHLLLRIFLGAQQQVPPAPVRINAPRLRPTKADTLKPAAKPRLDWQTIDESYARELRDGAEAIFQMEPPRRVTLGAVEIRLRRRDWLSKRRAKLPVSCAVARTIHEEVEAFQLRRLRWHAGQCRAEGVDDPWILLRRAGLKGSMINAARIELIPRNLVTHCATT